MKVYRIYNVTLLPEMPAMTCSGKEYALDMAESLYGYYEKRCAFKVVEYDDEDDSSKVIFEKLRLRYW